MLISIILNSTMSAGLIFIFSNTILPSLPELPDQYGSQAMHTIIVVIINPLFIVVFFGGVVSAVPAISMSWTRTNKEEYPPAANYYGLAEL